jgi:RNA polymerase sigma-70 factor (ECF subfamily)
MPLNHDSVLKMLLAHRGMLLGYIGAIVRDATLTEDVFQDTAILILQKREQLQDPRQFTEWARSIARLEAANTLRKNRKMPRGLDDGVLNSLEAYWRESDAVPDSDAIEALRGCVERLTSRTKQIIEMRYGQNMSSKEVAARLEQPANTIYVALTRAHRALADCVKLRLARENPRKEVKYG